MSAYLYADKAQGSTVCSTGCGRLQGKSPFCSSTTSRWFQGTAPDLTHQYKQVTGVHLRGNCNTRQEVPSWSYLVSHSSHHSLALGHASGIQRAATLPDISKGLSSGSWGSWWMKWLSHHPSYLRSWGTLVKFPLTLREETGHPFFLPTDASYTANSVHRRHSALGWWCQHRHLPCPCNISITTTQLGCWVQLSTAAPQGTRRTGEGGGPSKAGIVKLICQRHSLLETLHSRGMVPGFFFIQYTSSFKHHTHNYT